MIPFTKEGFAKPELNLKHGLAITENIWIVDIIFFNPQNLNHNKFDNVLLNQLTRIMTYIPVYIYGMHK